MKLMLRKFFSGFLFYLLVLLVSFTPLLYSYKTNSPFLKTTFSSNSEEEEEEEEETDGLKLTLEDKGKEMQKSLQKLLVLRVLPKGIVSGETLFYQLLQSVDKSFDDLPSHLKKIAEEKFFLPAQITKLKESIDQLLKTKFDLTGKRLKKYLEYLKRLPEKENLTIVFFTRYKNEITFDGNIVLEKGNSFLKTKSGIEAENIEFKNLSLDLLKNFYLFYAFEKQISSQTLKKLSEISPSSNKKENPLPVSPVVDAVEGFYETAHYFFKKFQEANIFSFHDLNLENKYQDNSFQSLSIEEKKSITTVFFEGNDHATFFDDAEYFIMELKEFGIYFQENYLKEMVQKYQYGKNYKNSVYPGFNFAIFQKLSGDSFVPLQELSPEILAEFIQLFLKSKDKGKSDINHTKSFSFGTYFDKIIFKKKDLKKKLKSAETLGEDGQKRQVLYQIFIINKHNKNSFLTVFKDFNNNFGDLNKKDFFSIQTKIKSFLLEIENDPEVKTKFEDQLQSANKYGGEELRNKQKMFVKFKGGEKFCDEALNKYKINYYCEIFEDSGEKSFANLNEAQKNSFESILSSKPKKPFFWLLHLNWAFFSLKYLSHFKKIFSYFGGQYSPTQKKDGLAFFAREKNAEDATLFENFKKYSKESEKSIPLEVLDAETIKTKNGNCFSGENSEKKLLNCKSDSMKFLKMVFEKGTTNLDQLYKPSFLNFNSFIEEGRAPVLSLLYRFLLTPKGEKQILNLLHYVNQYAKFSHFKNLSQTVLINVKELFRNIPNKSRQTKKNLIFYKNIDFTSLYKNDMFKKQYEDLTLQNMLKIYALDDVFFVKFITKEYTKKYTLINQKDILVFLGDSLKPMLEKQEEFFQKIGQFFNKNKSFLNQLKKIQNLLSKKTILGQKINFLKIFSLPFETSYEKLPDGTKKKFLLPLLVFADFSKEQVQIKENDFKKEIQIIIDEKVKQIGPSIRKQFQRFRAAGIQKGFSLHQKNKNSLVLSEELRANIDKNADQLSPSNQEELLDKFLFLENPEKEMQKFANLNIYSIFAQPGHDFKDLFNKLFFDLKLEEVKISSENTKISLTALAPFVKNKKKVYDMDSKTLKEIYPLYNLWKKEKLFSEFKAITDKFKSSPVVKNSSLTNLEIVFIVLLSFLSLFLIGAFGYGFGKKIRFNTVLSL